MKATVTIREFKPVGYGQVSRLWKDYGVFYEGLDGKPMILGMLKRNPRLLLVAEKKNRIIATSFASFDGRLGLISRLIIHQDHRRQGIGSAMMTELENWLREMGCQIIGLLVLDHNKLAIEMYERRGYNQLPQVRYMYKEIGN